MQFKFPKGPSARFVLFAVLVITALSSFLLFNVGMDIGGDDSAYVVRALQLVKDGVFPSFQGALYPIVLAPFIAIFGPNMLLLRFLSVVFILVSQVYFYKLFKTYFQQNLLLVLLLILAVNAYWLYYASLTYSEAFFTMLLAVTLYYTRQFFFIKKPGIKAILFAGGATLLLMKTKSIGAAYLVAILAYLLWNKQWKNAGIFALAFLGFSGFWELLVRLFFDGESATFSSQINGLFLKDPYSASKGMVEPDLLIKRFFSNMNIYLSRHFLQAFGLRGYGLLKTKTVLTLIVSIVSLALFVINFKRKSFFTFLGGFLFVAFATVFITPSMWDQARFIHPFIAFSLFWFFYNIKKILPQKFQPYMLIPGMTFVFLIGIHTYKMANENRPILKAYFHGDNYFGHTPDWVNYFKASEWVGLNLASDRYKVACRKPSISSIVSGKNAFYGLYTLPMYEVEKAVGVIHSISDKEFVVVDNDKITGKPVHVEVAKAFNNVCGGVFDDSGITNLIILKLDQDKRIHSLFETYDQLYQFIVPEDSLLKHQDYRIFLIDSLVENLYRNKVGYVMEANLRAIPEMKTDHVLSTVSNYRNLIRIKHRDMFEEVHIIGKESGEPVTIYQIHYPKDYNQDFIKTCNKLTSIGGNDMDIYNRTLQVAGKHQRVAYFGKLPPLEDNEACNFELFKSITSLNYTTFEEYAQKKKMDFALVDMRKLAEEQNPEVMKVIYSNIWGYAYVGKDIYRVLKGNHSVFDQLKGLDLVSSEKLKAMVGGNAASFNAVIPQFIFEELKDQHIRYVVVEKELKTNPLSAFMELVSPIYPHAFTEKAIGLTPEGKNAILYEVAYPKI